MSDDTLNPDEPLPDEITAWVSPREEHLLHFWTCGVVAAHNRAQYVRKDIHDALRARAEAAEAERDRLRQRAGKAEAALQAIADMEPHWAGQTPNEFHMQKIASRTLHREEGEE